MKRRFSSIIFLNLTVVIFLLSLQYKFKLLNHLEYKATDFFFHWRDPRPPSPDIALIAVDQPSIEEMGQFPWSRERHAQLLQLLTKAGAKAVAFDILFTEKNDINPEDDIYFGQVAAENEKTVVAMMFNKTQQGLPAEPLIPIEPL